MAQESQHRAATQGKLEKRKKDNGQAVVNPQKLTGQAAVRMSHVFLSDPVVAGMMAELRTTEARLKFVAELRSRAAFVLRDAAARIPVVSGAILAEYEKRGIVPSWCLDIGADGNYDNDQAVGFCLLLKNHNPTATEKAAAQLLRACIFAQENGDVPFFAQVQQAAKQSRANAGNRTNAWGVPADQRSRIFRIYQDRVANGTAYGAIKDLAARFEVSRTTIENIIRAEKKNSITK